MSIKANFSIVSPSIVMDFANSKTLDPRITFTRTTTGTYVGANGLIKTAGVDEARFDHDPETGESLGLLIEESRTNFITNSETPLSAQGANLTSSNLTVSAVSNVVSPDGTTNGVVRYTTNSNGSGTYRFGNTTSGTAGITYTGSIWIKSATGSDESMNIDVNDRGTLGFTVTTEWRRVSVSAAREDAATHRFMDINSGVNKDFYIWGPQLEEGSFITSYIPTSGSTVTRAADNAEITGTNFTDFYNQSEGTVFAIAEAPDLTNVVVASISNGTNNDKIEVRSSHTALTKARSVIRTDGTVVFDKSPTANTGRFRTLAFGVKPNDSIFSTDGILSTLETSVEIPSVSRLYLGNEFNSTTQRPGRIKRLTYYPQRLSDSQLQNLTK